MWTLARAEEKQTLRAFPQPAWKVEDTFHRFHSAGYGQHLKIDSWSSVKKFSTQSYIFELRDRASRAKSPRELAELTFDHLQQREDHWAVVDLIGEAGHIRTVPVPDWVKQITDEWVVAAGVGSGRLFRCVSRAGTVGGEGMTEKVVWHVVKEFATKLGVPKLAKHDLRRRSCARLCHTAGGGLEQIQFLLGHVSVQTTEKYYAHRNVM